jgi:FKBP-type peptidyl-prolyl cis-trans isomerase
MLITTVLLLACNDTTSEAPPAPDANAAKAEGKPAEEARLDTPTQAPPEKPTVPAPPDVAAPPADATTTGSGLAYKVLSKGSETSHPAATDKVLVHYSGWTTDGKMFDSSVTRNHPISFGLNQVIPGWTEGVQLMSPGDKFRFWIPEKLAYAGKPGAPAGMLVFDVELLKVLPQKVDAPADVAAPPKDSVKTSSGLAYKVIKSGSGGDHPGPTSMVEVDYTGWTTDGKMFDSTLTRGSTTAFPLDKVIAGWTEGVQLMKVGDTYRFWIPEELAYKGKPGKPQGMLVFDVTLVSIKEK